MNSTDPAVHRTAPATRRYDAIVVGARCAGAATAMLLAGKGYDVLLVDRASFPSDTVSTHVIHPPGLTALRRGGHFRTANGPRKRPSPHRLMT